MGTKAKRRFCLRWEKTGPGFRALALCAARSRIEEYHCSLWLWWGRLTLYWVTERELQMMNGWYDTGIN